MKVAFDEIPESGLELDIKDDSWFPDREFTRLAPISATIFLKRKHDRVLLDGYIEAMVQFECDRCLAGYKWQLARNFKIDFEYVEGCDSFRQIDEHACSESEMDVVYLAEPVLNVFSVLRQQVVLCSPAKRLCSEECKGLCPKCGMNLNKESCSCSGEDSSSAFKILAKLKNT